MKAILTLDIATVTGFAIGPVSAAPATGLEASAGVFAPQPLSGSERIGNKHQSDGAFMASWFDWLFDLIAVHDPAIIIYEAPFVSGTKHINTARRLLGMAAIVEMVAHQKGVKIFQAHNATIRKHFCGKGNAPRAELKQRVKDECDRRGWTYEDDNEADALALFDYACACLADGSMLS